MRIVQVPGPGGAAPPFRGGARGESPSFNSDASQLILGATCKGAKAGRSREACAETDGPPIGPRVLTRQLGFGWTGPAELWTALVFAVETEGRAIGQTMVERPEITEQPLSVTPAKTQANGLWLASAE